MKQDQMDKILEVLADRITELENALDNTNNMRQEIAQELRAARNEAEEYRCHGVKDRDEKVEVLEKELADLRSSIANGPPLTESQAVWNLIDFFSKSGPDICALGKNIVEGVTLLRSNLPGLGLLEAKNLILSIDWEELRKRNTTSE